MVRATSDSPPDYDDIVDTDKGFFKIGARKALKITCRRFWLLFLISGSVLWSLGFVIGWVADSDRNSTLTEYDLQRISEILKDSSESESNDAAAACESGKYYTVLYGLYKLYNSVAIEVAKF